jgi:hypothetical protein
MADERSAATMIQEIEFAPDSPLEETGFEPEVPAREGWVPLAEWEPSQRRQQAAETVPYLRGPSVRIPVVEAGGRPPPLVFGLD